MKTREEASKITVEDDDFDCSCIQAQRVIHHFDYEGRLIASYFDFDKDKLNDLKQSMNEFTIADIEEFYADRIKESRFKDPCWLAKQKAENDMEEVG